MDGDELLEEELGQKPPALQMFETAIVALQKPLQLLLRASTVVISVRFIAAFLRVVLEVHAEHEHIAPGWAGAHLGYHMMREPEHAKLTCILKWREKWLGWCAVDALGKLLGGLDHVGFLALEGTEVALIVLG